jgi:hypothetical protein
MTSHMFEVLFGPFDQARADLQREGLNYFLLSKKLGIADIRSGVGMFSPDHIGHYLGVKWTDGTNYLLTWLGPGVEPLSPGWLAEYRKQVFASPVATSFMQSEATFRDIYASVQANPDPAWGRDLPLPWLAPRR